MLDRDETSCLRGLKLDTTGDRHREALQQKKHKIWAIYLETYDN